MRSTPTLSASCCRMCRVSTRSHGGYPARHGIPHGTVSHKARFIVYRAFEDVWHVVCCMDGVLSRHHEILPKHTTMHATYNDVCNIQCAAHKRSRVRTRSLGLACACGVWAYLTGSPLPHLHRDWAHPCPPLPHLHRDWARSSAPGTRRYASGICIIVMCAAFFPAQRLQFNALIAENVVHRSSMAGSVQYTRVLLRASCPTCCPLAPSLPCCTHGLRTHACTAATAQVPFLFELIDWLLPAFRSATLAKPRCPCPACDRHSALAVIDSA